ncbi:CBS domain-containing protein [Streptomyces sp. NPDC008125]|uniref:CBS domain-containing protein n=1 Tax=Streptomyces sp. NPDC008125 TaxID=3364811 RepID=UPI0036E110FB
MSPTDAVQLSDDGPQEPRVGDDMTVEVALSVMTSARVDHLLVCDNDGLCTGIVTLARLAAVREGTAYTDRIRLRDLLADERDGAPGLLALAH